jgi:hypothetical protein
MAALIPYPNGDFILLIAASVIYVAAILIYNFVKFKPREAKKKNKSDS